MCVSTGIVHSAAHTIFPTAPSVSSAPQPTQTHPRGPPFRLTAARVVVVVEVKVEVEVEVEVEAVGQIRTPIYGLRPTAKVEAAAADADVGVGVGLAVVQQSENLKQDDNTKPTKGTTLVLYSKRPPNQTTKTTTTTTTTTTTGHKSTTGMKLR